MNRDKVKVAQIEVCETAKKMSSSGLVAGTWGNISARVDDEYMVITPLPAWITTSCSRRIWSLST